MKKLMAVILMACLLCGAFALAETTLDKDSTTGTTTLIYTVSQIEDPTSYVVTIPSTIAFDSSTKEANGNIVIGANPVLTEGKRLNIRMNSDYTLEETSDSTLTLAYAFRTAGGNTTQNSVVLGSWSADQVVSDTSVPLSFVLTQEPATAGTYSDSVTFIVSLID